jgi:hypothetical protein
MKQVIFIAVSIIDFLNTHIALSEVDLALPDEAGDSVKKMSCLS